MKRLLFLWSILICSIAAKAQNQYPSLSPGIVFTSASPIYTNTQPITITATGETKDLAIDVSSDAPQVYGAIVVNSPSNVSASSIGMSSISVTQYWTPTGKASIFKANVTNTSGIAAKVTFTLLVMTIDYNNPINSPGFCTVTYTVTINPGSQPPTQVGNDPQSGPWYKQGCGTGFTGGTVAKTVPANSYFATTKSAANALASAAGQTYVNATAQCIALVGNTLQTGQFYSQTCAAATYAANPVTYPVQPNSYYAADLTTANGLAQADVQRNGQAYANNYGPSACSPLPAPVITNVSAVGTLMTATFNYTTPPYATNAIELQAVDNLTGQIYDSTNGTESSGSLTLIAGHTYNISVIVFDSQHNSTDNTSAPYPPFIMPGTFVPPTTYYNTLQSGTFIKNTCGAGFQGSSYTTTVQPMTAAYNSLISQTDANSKAMAYINSVGQTNANTYGTCTAVSGVPTFTMAYGGHGGLLTFAVTPNIPNPNTSILYWTDTNTGQTGSSAGAPGGWTSTFTDMHTYQFHFVCYGSGTPSSGTSATQTYYMP